MDNHLVSKWECCLDDAMVLKSVVMMAVYLVKMKDTWTA